MNLVWKYIFRTALKYGLTCSIIILVFFSVLLYSDKNIFNPALSLLAGLIVLVFILFSIIEYNQIDVVPKFWKNMSVGIINYIIVALIYFLFMMIIINLVRPELLNDYISDRIAMMDENKGGFIEKFGEETYIKTLQDVKDTSPYDLALDGLIKISFIGLFSTIFISLIYLFFKTKKITS